MLFLSLSNNEICCFLLFIIILKYISLGSGLKQTRYLKTSVNIGDGNVSVFSDIF